MNGTPLDRGAKYVWCAEDAKYGVQAIYSTKRSAERDWTARGAHCRWPSGEGGTIIKRKVYD